MSPDFKTSELGLPNVNADEITLANILGTIFLIIGAVSVVIIIIAGLQYITSGGDPEKAKRAKNTILYAVIGLVVALFATAIVNFVLGSNLFGT